MSADPVRQKSPWKSIHDPKLDIEGRLARLAQFHLEDVRDQQALLSKFGFQQAIFKRRVLPAATVWLLAFGFVAGVGWFRKYYGAPDDFATAIVAMCAFVFGYYQWRSSHHEKAMEDFYSRLNLANQRRESARLVSSLLGHPWEENANDEDTPSLQGYNDHRWTMYVYSELDNLEYVVEKYNLGYMEARHALRGLRTFYQRCFRKPFRDRAWKCALFMAYNKSTIKVVEKVCQDIEEQRKAPRNQGPQGPGRMPRGLRLADQLADKAAL